MSLGFNHDGLMSLYSSITSVIKWVNNPVYHEKTKHVEVDSHFICKKLEEDVAPVQVPTKDQLANFLTEAINKAKLHFSMSSRLGIVNNYAPA